MGQSTLEYALVLAIILAGLIGVQRFVKASLMGRWKTISDNFGFGRQFEPGQTVVSD